MKKGYLMSFVILLISISSISQNYAYLQISSESGIKVYLDDKFYGETSEEFNGLIISDLNAGTYNIKFTKEGFNPQIDMIELAGGRVLEYKVKPFTPKIIITESGEMESKTISAQTGTIIIQSLPISIKISIPTLGIEYDKKQDLWKAEDVPVGEYYGKFVFNNKELESIIEIKNSHETKLFVNMISMKVENRSDLIIKDKSKHESTYSGKTNNLINSLKVEDLKSSYKKPNIEHPNTSSLFYCDRNLYKSTDSGNTWNVIFSPSSFGVKEEISILSLHPDNDDIILVTVGKYFFRTTDSGNTWSKSHFKRGDKDWIINFAAVHPTKDNVFLIGNESRLTLLTKIPSLNHYTTYDLAPRSKLKFRDVFFQKTDLGLELVLMFDKRNGFIWKKSFTKTNCTEVYIRILNSDNESFYNLKVDGKGFKVNKYTHIGTPSK